MRKNYFLIGLLILLVLPCSAQLRFTEEINLKSDDIQSLAYDGVNIWVKHRGKDILSALDPVSGEKFFELKLAASGETLAYDGRNLLLTQTEGRQILAVNRATGEVCTYIDLKTIEGDRDLYLTALRSGKIMGITCGDNRIWIACSAGYSSSIYEIEPVRQVVVSHRYSPGPEPASLAYYNGNLWVLDRANNALRCLKDCDQLVYDLSIPLDEDSQAFLEILGMLFVACEGQYDLKGISMQELDAVVPEMIQMETYNPYSPDQTRTEGPRKVAVLISGDTAATGFNEFWTDVVIMHRILEARGYGEIYVLYADGSNYKPGWDKYEMAMTDFAATKANVVKVFNALASGDSSLHIDRMEPSDTLFVYTFDHGDGSGRLCLWQGERYTPSEMANAIRNINCGKKYFYMQQCFSGAFKEQFKSVDLDKVAIVTACSHQQYAYRADTEYETYNGKKFYHGEFNWHFMSALAGTTPSGTKVNADTNGDGMVSIIETFEYYQKMNSQPRQTPQYHSKPDSLGKDTTP